MRAEIRQGSCTPQATVKLNWPFVADTKFSGEKHSAMPTMVAEWGESDISKSDHIWAQIPAIGTQASEFISFRSSGVKWETLIVVFQDEMG